MLFQTLVQLNILILATPALAGWSLLPPVHGVTGCVAGIVWHRAAEASTPKTVAVSETRQATRTPALMRLSLPTPLLCAAVSAAAPQTVPVSLLVLPPHAARAP